MAFGAIGFGLQTAAQIIAGTPLSIGGVTFYDDEKFHQINDVHLLTPYLGQQSPPQGNERCLLIRTEDGSYCALVYPMNDDTPQAPAGEWWAQRFSVNTPPSDQTQFVRIQNDGGTRIGGASKVVVLSPVTNLGAESLPSNKGVVTQDDLQAAINALQQSFQNAINQLAQIVSAGKGVPPPTVQGATAQSSTTVFASD